MRKLRRQSGRETSVVEDSYAWLSLLTVRGACLDFWCLVVEREHERASANRNKGIVKEHMRIEPLAGGKQHAEIHGDNKRY
jgi:hypothetical protein